MVRAGLSTGQRTSRRGGRGASFIPSPKELEERVNKVFKKYNEPKYGIITDKVLKQHYDNLIHIRSDCISDIKNKPSEYQIQGI
jgi:hypothetical protein